MIYNILKNIENDIISEQYSIVEILNISYHIDPLVNSFKNKLIFDDQHSNSESESTRKLELYQNFLILCHKKQ